MFILDFDVYKALWDWCRRRHPNKGSRWIIKKYFHTIGNRTWTFSVPFKDKADEYIRLIYATDTNIRRFTKICAEATPYREKWNEYFEQREEHKMLNNLKGRAILNKIWKSQNGYCKHCNCKITTETDFRIQKLANGVMYLVHPYCFKRKDKLSNNELAFQQMESL